MSGRHTDSSRNQGLSPITLVLVLMLALLVVTETRASWRRHTIDFKTRGADGVRLADVNGDRLKPGVAWLRGEAARGAGPWNATDVSRDEGVKFDLLQLYDVDHDGDRDIVTTEERDNLGVVWYENPTRGGIKK